MTCRLVCVLLGALVACAAGMCARESAPEEKGRAPVFICEFFVDERATLGCATEVTETILLPHTVVEGGFIRDILFFGQTQAVIVSNVSVTTEARPEERLVPFEKTKHPLREFVGFGDVRVNISTFDSDVPVRLKLVYTVSNGVSKFTRSCVDGVESDASKNEMDWSAGPLEFDVDLLQLSFRTDAADAEVQYIGHTHNEPPEITSDDKYQNVTLRNVPKAIFRGLAVYVMEFGGRQCKTDFLAPCQTDDEEDAPSTAIAVGGIIGIVLGILVVACVVGFFMLRVKRSRERNMDEGKEPRLVPTPRRRPERAFFGDASGEAPPPPDPSGM